MHVLLDELAETFAAQGKRPKAIEWEAKAIELAPDEPTKEQYRSRLREYQAARI